MDKPNYKHLYEQTKRILEKYQDEIMPGYREKIKELEADSVHNAGGCYCRECKWWDIDRPDGSNRCLKWGGLRDLKPTDFCSNGQTREGRE